MAFEDTGMAKIREELKKGRCLLSRLGLLLNEDERPEVPLRHALENQGIYISREGNGPIIYASLSKNNENNTVESSEYIKKTKFKYPVFLAFTMKLPETRKIGLKIGETVKYSIYEGILPEGVIEIEDRYRLPGYCKDNFSDISNLYDKVKEWSNENNVNFHNLIYTDIKEKTHSDIETILKAFLDAQPEEIRDKINFPSIFIQRILKG